MRQAWIAIAVALLATGCGWLQPGFDAGRSAANGAESAIGIGNVAQLTHHTIPNGTASIVVGNLLVGTSASSLLVAFDRATCPTPSSDPCTPVWSSSSVVGGAPASDGTTIFTAYHTSDANTLYATGLDGNLKWSAPFPYLQSTENPFGSDIVVSGGKVLFGIRIYDHGTNRYDTTVQVLPANGCGQPTCSAERSIAVLGTANFVASGTTMIALVEGTSSTGPTAARVRALDVTTGSQLWRSQWFDDSEAPSFSPAHGRFVAHGGAVSFHQYETSRTDLYAIDGSACSGTPKTCTRLRNLDGTGDPGAFSDHTIVTEGNRLAWYDATGAGCSGSPVRCPRLAVTASGESGSVKALGIANGVVYASVGTAVQAFDERAQQGCTGSPITCTASWSYDLGAHNSVRSFALWDGRVYVTAHNSQTSADTQHVFSLPE